MVLATDEVYTYAIWNYAVLNWLSHTEAGGDTTKGEGGVPAYVSHLATLKLLSVVSRSHCRFGSHLIKHFAQKEIHLHISHTHTHARCKHRNVHYWRLPSNGKVFVGFLFVADFDSLHISNISLMF